ncbi:MAG: 50S ribosomal protein L11 methyltransferase [Pyrinomonadaceae bacterium]
MKNDQKGWFAVSVTVKTAATEAIEFAFNSLDSLGTEINDMPKADRDSVTVIGYFQNLPDEKLLRNEFDKSLEIYGLLSDSIAAVTSTEVKNEDWLAEWKKHWKPTHIGRFVIAAPWHLVNDPEKIVIRIEPNMAFGTGTHETTQLCLAAIDEHYRAGQTFLDVGTGTGILAIAAAKMAEGSKIIACDTDGEAVAIARENAEVNRVGNQIEFFTGPISADLERFDFVCANLTADVIIPILPLLIEKTRETLVMSGILAEQEESIVNAFPQELAGKYFITHSGEWISVTVGVD